MILPKQSACSVEEKKSNKHPQNNELSVQQTLSSFAHLLSAEDTLKKKGGIRAATNFHALDARTLTPSNG